MKRLLYGAAVLASLAAAPAARAGGAFGLIPHGLFCNHCQCGQQYNAFSPPCCNVAVYHAEGPSHAGKTGLFHKPLFGHLGHKGVAPHAAAPQAGCPDGDCGGYSGGEYYGGAYEGAAIGQGQPPVADPLVTSPDQPVRPQGPAIVPVPAGRPQAPAQPMARPVAAPAYGYPQQYGYPGMGAQVPYPMQQQAPMMPYGR